MAASEYHVISMEVENYIFKHNWLFTHLCINTFTADDELTRHEIPHFKLP